MSPIKDLEKDAITLGDFNTPKDLYIYGDNIRFFVGGFEVWAGEMGKFFDAHDAIIIVDSDGKNRCRFEKVHENDNQRSTPTSTKEKVNE